MGVDAALGAKRAERDRSQRGRGRALALAVGHADPGAVVVFDVVEPVAAA